MKICDFFGYRIGFNVEGEEVHRTIGGGLVSIFIFVWLGVVLIYLRQQFVVKNLDRPLTVMEKPNYYRDVPVTTDISGDQFRFAVGMSSIDDFTDTDGT
jgi:hypothetical protein